MKKILFLIVSLIGVGVTSLLVSDIWKTTEIMWQRGTEGTLKVERQYNASRWSEPLPVKKIHVYVGTLAPNHEVVVETDQELTLRKPYFIRFLTHDKADALRGHALRPIAGALRQRLAEDATPPGFEPSAPLDQLVDKAMGTTAKPKVIAQPSAGHGVHSVPFLLGGANDSVAELIWYNTALGEWAALCVLITLTVMTGLNGFFTPWRARIAPSDEPDFIHPAMRKIEADKPSVSSQRLKLAPKPVPAAIEAVRVETTEPATAPLKLSRKPAAPDIAGLGTTDSGTKKAAGDSGGPLL